MRKTKIIATVGPASRSEKDLIKLIKSGVNVLRINLSHGQEDIYTQDIKTIQSIREKLKLPISIMVDTRGPEIRVKSFKNGKVVLKHGQVFTLTSREIMGDENEVQITQPIVVALTKINRTVLANDGKIKMKIVSKTDTDIVCKVVIGGELSNNKGLTFVEQTFPLEFIGEKDRYDLLKTLNLGIEYISASFVNSKEDIIELKELIDSVDSGVKIISKIENHFALKNIDEILDNSAGVMVARGDLGVEMNYDKLPIIQKEILFKATQKSKICIVATEMLESMIQNSRPTRAEINDVASAVFLGASAVMLSGETAVGKNPALCVSTMAKILITTENSLNYHRRFDKEKIEPKDTRDLAIHCAIEASFFLNCKAIVCYTTDGSAAQLLCTRRVGTPIACITNTLKTFYQFAMFPNCIGVYQKTAKDIFEVAENVLIEKKLIKSGDLFVIATGNSNKISNVVKFQYAK